MKRESRERSQKSASAEFARAGSSHVLRVLPATEPLATDADLLRLSYVCRADALLRGRAGRSAVLARIHRLFDGTLGARPDATALASLSALIDRARSSVSGPAGAIAGEGRETESARPTNAGSRTS